jgi:predicted HTH domain antitoxin
METRNIVIQVPEDMFLAAQTDEAGFARTLAETAAVKLFEVGQLSSGRSTELASVSRIEFLDLLSQYSVFPFAAELRDLETGNA